MKNRYQWVVVASVVGVFAGGLAVATLLSPDFFLVAEGADAPAFTAERLGTGEEVGLDAYRGKVVLLNIWATNCPPCVEEMPSLQRLHEAMSDEEDFVVVAVSTDVIGSDQVHEWTTERGLTFDILHDRSGRIARDYQTTGIPETFVIDRTGLIVRKVIGAREWDDPVERAVINRALRSGSLDL